MSSLRSRRLLLVVGGLVASLAVLGGAYAAGGNQKNASNPTNEAVVGPLSVAGTSAGMPPTSQVRFMVVNSDGTRARGFPSGANFTSTRLSTGTYELLFNVSTTSITGCAFIGTIGLSGTSGSSAPGEITVVGRAGKPNGIFVQTFDSTGTLADRGFHMAVVC